MTADMAELIGTELAIQPTPEGRSRQITWSEIEEADPDVVIVACCGFDLERNVDDAASSAEHFAKLRCNSNRNNSLYAANGDQYFARPSPKLLIGVFIMALCVYSNDETDEEPDDLVRAIRDLPFFPSEALDSFRAMKY
jgi:ABC-type Fe3+-hydroxamate transport system substrate-binding protein